MKHIIDLIPCLYFSSSDEGKIIEVNDDLCTQLQYTQEELIGQRTELIFTVATCIFQQTHLYPILKIQGHVEEIYITLLTKSRQELPVLINARREVIEGQSVNLHIGIVVNNRKKFEEELLAAKKAAENALNENLALNQLKQQLEVNIEQLDKQMLLANKQYEELKQFNRVVTHDLQEPLRKLLLFVNMMLERNTEEVEKSIATKIKRSSEQLRSIISGLQQYVWLTDTPSKFTAVCLNNLVLLVQQELKRDFPEVNLIIDKYDLPSIEGDWDQLKMLFYQILSNAIMFRKPGKEAYVHIEATSLMVNKYKTVIDKYKYEEELKIQFTDKGIGFDNMFKDQVFELFKRLHAQSGLGIGLSLCRKIIQNHHGTISIESWKDEKTIVSIWLPINKEAI